MEPVMEKRCFKCLCTKPLSAFYRHTKMSDGHLNKCIECTKQDARDNRIANIERVREYDRMRGSMPHRVAARAEYQKTPEGRAAHQRALKASSARYPARAQARIRFRNAVRDGKVIPWPVCSLPECDKKPEAHHPDYSAPLAVVWLCNQHHREAHLASEEAPI